MKATSSNSRRGFIRDVTLCGAGAFLLPPGISAAESQKENDEENDEDEIPPTEDLMREHGVLKRVLLVHREIVHRLGTSQDFPPEAVASAAGIIRQFIEDYHEKLEENYLFPRFEKSGKHVDLTRVLREQHQAGRRLTDATLSLANNSALKAGSGRERLSHSLRQFIRIYEPHEAREDTVLFPALRKIVTPQEFGALGEDFEKKEHQLFGEDGFEQMVNKIAGIEKQLGIYDLSEYTPKV
jgi:hemerythrin-like domain-containing protein